MNFQESYDYLNSLSNLRRKEYMTDPRHCSIYLKRLQFFLNLIGNPEKKIPHYIHVTGTSGKGSVCLFLQSILHADKKKVGTLLSPHPTHITERWQIGGKNMNKKKFIEIVNFFRKKLDEYIQTSPYDMLSFHEITTAVGLYYFAKKKVDWAILEVGCGGRYDSTNIIPHKDIAVITNIDLDHVETIGDTKEKIAYEKAGVIKRGCKVFTMEQDSKLLEIIKDECKSVSTQGGQASLQVFKCSSVQDVESNVDGSNFDYNGESYKIQALGRHQVQNAVLAINIAQELGTPTKAIQTGLQKTTLPIRMEVIQKNPTIILDSAHNADKIKTTTNTTCKLEHLNTCRLIIGFSENKEINKILKTLTKLNPKTIACTRNTINPFRKVADPKDLEKKCKKLFSKAEIKTFLDPQQAYNWAKKKTRKHDILLITGSVFLSGELRGVLTKKSQ